MPDTINNRTFSRRTDRLSSSLIRELLALTDRPEMISFAGGLPASQLMPELSLGALPESLSQYGTTDGESEFRIRIADHVKARGLQANAEQVLVTSGSQQGIDLVAKLFIDEGTPVCLEKPAYLAALQVFRLFGADLKGIAIQPDGICLESLQKQLETVRPAFLYINPDFQNPTGYYYSERRRKALAELLDRFSVPLVEDNPYGELYYDDAPCPPVSSYLKNTPWVYLGSFSKVAVPAWRIGYMVSHPDLASWFAKLKQGTDLHTNRPGQWWCSEYLKNKKGYQQHIVSLRDYYRAQRDAMQSALQHHLSDLADWHQPGGGLFFWIKLRQIAGYGTVAGKSIGKKCGFFTRIGFFSSRPS